MEPRLGLHVDEDGAPGPGEVREEDGARVAEGADLGTGANTVVCTGTRAAVNAGPPPVEPRPNRFAVFLTILTKGGCP